MANEHEWALAYNASEPIRAVAGKTLAAQVVQFLNGTIADAASDTGQKYAVQFGAYGSFSSFFGLSGMTSLGPDWYGIVDYASSMAFEMFTNVSTAVTAANYPSEDNIYVRFLFYNGTATNSSPPVPYPLFGTGQEVLKWNDFKSHINSFALGTTGAWCVACGNTTGVCEGYGPSSSSSGSSSKQHSGNGLSPAVNGVIGAMVTLAVVLGVEALIMVIFGLRLVSKKRLAQGAGGAASPGSGDPKA